MMLDWNKPLTGAPRHWLQRPGSARLDSVNLLMSDFRTQVRSQAGQTTNMVLFGHPTMASKAEAHGWIFDPGHCFGIDFRQRFASTVSDVRPPHTPISLAFPHRNGLQHPFDGRPCGRSHLTKGFQNGRPL
jgi:hypothetical protein